MSTSVADSDRPPLLDSPAPPRNGSAAFAHDRQFERVVATLHDAALDDEAWPQALALIDDACGMHSSHLAVLDTGRRGNEYVFGAWLGHGVRLDALAQEYAERCFAVDERVSRLLLMPAGSLLHNADLWAEGDPAGSRACHEFLARSGIENQISVWLPVLDGLQLLWTVSRARAQGEWRPAHLGVLRRLLPHVRGAVRVCQALAKADARASAFAQLVDAPPQGAAFLARWGGVLEASAGTKQLLAKGGLFEQSAQLCASSAGDDRRLGQLLAQALPERGRLPRGGTVALGEHGEVRVDPVVIDRWDFGARRVAVIVSIHTNAG